MSEKLKVNLRTILLFIMAVLGILFFFTILDSVSKEDGANKPQKIVSREKRFIIVEEHSFTRRNSTAEITLDTKTGRKYLIVYHRYGIAISPYLEEILDPEIPAAREEIDDKPKPVLPRVWKKYSKSE